MEWIQQQKFRVMLVALLLFILVFPTVHNHLKSQIEYNILVTAMFLGTFWIVFSSRKLQFIAVLLGVPTLLSTWTGFLFPGLPRGIGAGVYHVFAVLFLALAILAIMNDIYRDSGVSPDSVCGAFCAYLLLGVAFAHMYCLIDILIPNAFRGLGVSDPDDEAQAYFRLAYFSLITLTTLGYGDIVPAIGAARSFAVVEAICGQFFVAVLVAELIGKRVALAIDEREQRKNDKVNDPM